MAFQIFFYTYFVDTSLFNPVRFTAFYFCLDLLSKKSNAFKYRFFRFEETATAWLELNLVFSIFSILSMMEINSSIDESSEPVLSIFTIIKVSSSFAGSSEQVELIFSIMAIISSIYGCSELIDSSCLIKEINLSKILDWVWLWADTFCLVTFSIATFSAVSIAVAELLSAFDTSSRTFDIFPGFTPEACRTATSALCSAIKQQY